MKTFFASLHDDRTKKALFLSIIDGILWATMFGLAENYIVPFILFFGATAFHTSLMQGGTQLGISIAQLLGARVVHRLKKRQLLTIVCIVFHASSFLIMPFVAILTKNYWVIIATFTLGVFINNVASPGWASWMNDIIPPRIRGAFWGFRNRIINMIQFCAIIIAGTALYFAEKNHLLLVAYVILFGTAGVSRMGSTIPLSKQFEPKMVEEKKGEEITFSMFLSHLASSNFGRFALFSFLLTFAVNVMAPVIPVYLLKSLNFNYLEFSIIILAPMVTAIFAMSYWGKLADRYGNYRILLITAVSIPLFGIGWAFIKNIYLLILIQLFSGFVWSGFNLSNQNYIFDSVKPHNVPKIFAYFISLNNLSAFVGSLSGGLLTLVTKQFNFDFFAPNNFELIFLLSGLLRIFIIFFFIKSFREVRKVDPSPKFHHFYFYLPMSSIYNRIALGFGRLQKKRLDRK